VEHPQGASAPPDLRVLSAPERGAIYARPDGKRGIDVMAPMRPSVSFLDPALYRAVLQGGTEAPHDPYSKIPSRVEVNAGRQSGR